jgi:hypothetical protein
MRLQAVRVPDANDRRLRHARRLRHRPRAPVRGFRLGRAFLERFADHALDIAIRDGARRTRPRRVEQAIESLGKKPRAPFADGAAIHAHGSGHLGARRSRCTREDDGRSFRQRPRRLRSTAPRRQLRDLCIREHQGLQRWAAHHGGNLVLEMPSA